MKRVFFLVSLIFTLALTSQAQTASVFPLVATDSINTSASLDSVWKDVPVTAGYASAGFGLNFTKISGTVTVKAYLYASMDGVNYVLTDSAAAAYANAAGVQTVLFNKTAGVPYAKYRMMIRNVGATTSTEVGQCRFWYALRRHN